MGAISELFDLVSLGKSAQKAAKIDPNDTKTVASFFQKAKSISSRASKYVLEYPTICSSSITSYDTALTIAKQVEFDCARFIILSSGLNPFVRLDKNDTIEAHLTDLVSSYESYSGLRVGITEATPEQVAAGDVYMRDHFNKSYESFNRETNSKFMSFEVTDVDITSGGSVEPGNYPIDVPKGYYMEQVKSILDSNSGIREYDIVDSVDENNDPTGSKTYQFTVDKNGQFYTKPGEFNAVGGISNIKDISEIDESLAKPTDPELLKEWEAANKYFNENKNNVVGIGKTALHDEILKGLGKVKPTIVNVDFYLIDSHGGQSKVSVPLAIKSNLQFINSADIVDLIGKTRTPGYHFNKLIRLTTGELNFIKDFILGLDDAKKDVEREKTIGHTPFYRRLLSNKSRYRIKNISETITPLKGIISRKKQKDLPMFTIIVDEHELTRASGIKFSYMIKDRTKFIDYFLDTYMLLGLGVVDKDNDVVHFFYSGEDSHVTVRISELGDKSKDSGSVSNDIAKTLANMSRVIAGR